MSARPTCLLPALLALAAVAFGAEPAAVRVQGEIIEAASGRALPARLSIRGAGGVWHFAQSAATEGSAIRYERQRANTSAVEMHTTLSAHPFTVSLPPGSYTFIVARGKEFLPITREVTVAAALPKLSFPLRRWSDVAQAGWYSGDTHVHRPPAELANVMLAEDVNVVLPLLDWTDDASLAPSASPRSLGAGMAGELVRVDATHVWFPRNTEFEIFRVADRRHMLGAFFVLNHRTRFTRPLFPVAEVIRQARAEGAVLDLEKHNWPWTIAMAPLLQPALIELANNHHWEVGYTVKNWAVPAPAWMQLSGSGTDTERDWTSYGLQTYYALLNCGLRLSPTGGSASGVHPVPLGFSRVYVQLDEPFGYEAWLRGLAAGRSFVTTGPMLLATVNSRPPGATFSGEGTSGEFNLACVVRSEQPLESIELIVNGEVAKTFPPANTADGGAFQSEIATTFRPRGSSWVAWRCFESRPGDRIRFAHTAPWHFEVSGQPLRPRRAEAAWLVRRVQEEIARNRGVAPPDLIADFERALKFYEDAARRVRD